MWKTGHSSAEHIPMDAKLKKLLMYYSVSALFATVLISGAILSEKYILSLSGTLDKFQTLKINRIKMKDASKNVKETIINVRSMFPSYDKTEAMEGTILTTVDSIKSRLKGADVTITNFERKGGEVELPITLTGTIRNYTEFIHHIGYFQSLTSPLFYINGVTISDRSDEKGAMINFEIRGALKMQSHNPGSGS